MSLVKAIIKFAILTLFILERFYYYRNFKAIEGETKDLHHEILPGYEVDFGKVNAKYDTHQIFSIPFTKSIVDGLKNYVFHKTNLNQTLAHERHPHIFDLTHSFQNKIIDSDIKFNFYFLTAYDLIITSVLMTFLFTDTFAGNFLLLGDSALKVLSLGFHHLKDYRLSSFYYMIYTLIKDSLKRDFVAMWVDIIKLYDREKVLALNSALFALYFLLFSYNFTTSVKDFIFGKSGKKDIKDSMELAARRIHQVVEEIEEKTGSPLGKVLREGAGKISSPDLGQMRTLETEENINEEGNRPSYEKLKNKNRKNSPIDRDLTPSKRRREKPSF